MNRRSTFLAASGILGLGLLIGCGGSTNDSSSFSGGFTAGSTAGGNGQFSNQPTATTNANVVIPGNAIVFTIPSGEKSDKVDIRTVAVDGSEEQLFATTNAGIQGLAINPANRTQKYFGAQRGSVGKFGIWRNTTLDPTSAISVVTPTYDAIYTVAVTKDGKKVLFTATTDDGSPKLYVADATKVGAKATEIDDAVSFTVSPDGKDVIYSKAGESSLDLFRRTLAETKSAKIVANPGDDDLPQYSKDGSRIVFVSNKPEGLSDIYTAKPTGTDQFQVTNTPGEAETAPSYNADASAIAYIVPGGAAAGIYRSPSASGTRISVKVADGITSTYWTDGTGRSRTMQVYNLNRRAVKPKPTKKPEAKAEAPKAPK